ncbi:MAG: heme-binding beta-barrel domain-containing protein [Bowdeniella nasicola]|nr:heme-binding beta-barrel domain-containing protein [Bowdeniella nasicola]
MSTERTGIDWLIGNWRGWGIWNGYGLKDQVVLEHLDIRDDGGPYLQAQSTHYLAAGGTIAGDADARSGYSQLSRGEIWVHETYYLRVDPTLAGRQLERYPIELMLANPAGYVVAGSGVAEVGPHQSRLAVASDTITRTNTGADIDQLERHYLWRGDELFIRATMSAFGYTAVPYLNMRLAKEDDDATR